MAYNGTNPVSVGLPTKKDHFDRVFNNTVANHDDVRNKYTFLVDAVGFQPDLTNGCDYSTVATITAGRALLIGCGFSGTADQFAQFRIPMPKAWNAGNVSYRVRWATPNSAAGNVVYSLQALACSDGDAIDAAFGTAVNVSDTYQATGVKTHRTAESGVLTIAGSPAKSDFVYFRFGRLATDGGDTKADKVYVEAIELFITTDEANDA